jgi:hypothetical protein
VIRSEQIQRWEERAAPTLRTLAATLIDLGQAARQGPLALMAARDQLAAAARDARTWMSAHTCPLPDIEDRLNRTMRSYRNLVRLLEDGAGSPDGPDLRVIDQEIEGLIAMIATTVTVLGDQTDT